MRVPNYVDPFIRPQDTPAHIWPINAADWGFIEWLPSQTDMVPIGEFVPYTVGHPALNHNGHIHHVYSSVYPAFSYW